MQRISTAHAIAVKKIFAVVASLALVAMMVPLPAFAEGEPAPSDPTGMVAAEPAAEQSAEAADAEDEAAADEAASDDAADSAASEQAELEAGGMSLMAAGDAVDAGPFKVVGEESSWSYGGGVLTITGDCTVSTDGKVTDSIVIAGDCTVTLDGVEIAPSAARAAITVNPDVSATVALAEGTVNTLTGGSNHAGLQVSWESEDQFGAVTIVGPGTLEATGGSGSGGAGIGGSYGEGHGINGDITIKSGTVKSTGTNRSAGIGSANNTDYSYGNTERGTITIDGGTVNAYGVSNGAGIGGGNHFCSGPIIINGGTIYAEGDSGIGTGLGSNKDTGIEKGPGWVCANVTINGGNVTAYATDNMGAGIGGGMYGDGIVTINGGVVTASVSTAGNAYQGGAGIGGGYQGCGIVTINGGTVTATGGNGSPGIGDGALAAVTTSSAYNSSTGEWSGTKTVRTNGATIKPGESGVAITGGTVVARGGDGGSGIGSGNSSEWCNVSITGGNVTAIGWASSEGAMAGAAGIGSGVAYSDNKPAYMKQTTENISITGGTIVAIGGWGAAGIGSGARNDTADSITIDAENASVQAYSDGTKTAIDTPQGDSAGSNVTVTGNLLQSTFVHVYKDAEGNVQGTEGLKSIIVKNEATGETQQLVLMPDSYRSFATDVADPGTFAIYTDSPTIGDSGEDASGAGAYFSVYPGDEWSPDTEGGKNANYGVVTGVLSNYAYLFPVKTIIVNKEVVALDHEDVEGYLDGLTETFYFAVADYKGDIISGPDGEPWILPVEVVDGVPQNDVLFANMNDGDFEIWETDAEGNQMSQGTVFGDFILKKIRTRHGEGTDNNASLAPGTWTDQVTVVNSFIKSDDDVPDDPTPPNPDNPTPTPTPGPTNPTNPTPPNGSRPTVTTPAAPVNPPATPGIGASRTKPSGPAASSTNGVAPSASAAADVDCWVHWWMILGIVITALYSIGVLARRSRNSSKLGKLDDHVMGADGQQPAPAAPAPGYGAAPQPTMTAGQGV